MDAEHGTSGCYVITGVELPLGVASKMCFSLKFPAKIIDWQHGTFLIDTPDRADQTVKWLKEHGFPMARRV